MKIATWNMERLKHKSKLEEINFLIDELNAYILILTETDVRISPKKFRYKIVTPKLMEIAPKTY